MPKENSQWVLPGVFAATILIASMMGMLPHTLVMFLLPVMMAVCAYTSGVVPTILTGCVAIGGCFLAGAGVLWIIAVPWSALNCLAALLPLKDPKRRVWLWAGVIVIMWTVYVLLLQSLLGGDLVTGMARELQNQLSQSPMCDSVLISAYNSGMARTKDPMTLSSMYVSSMLSLALPEATRTELLNSLRVSIEEMMPAALCEGFIGHVLIVTVLCTLLPDSLRRKNGEKGVYPKFTEWHMPSGIGLAVGALALGFVICLMTESDLWMKIGLLSSSVFSVAYGLQGVSFQLWLEDKMGMGKIFRVIWVVGILLLAPFIMVILGLIDQRRDARNLRKDKEVTI